MNLSETVERFAEDMPDHIALAFEDRRMSYGDLQRSINRMANALAKAGVGKGDCVALIMGNRPEFVVTYFAAMRLGAVAVTLNPVSTVYELSHYFAECKPKAVVCKEDQVAKIRQLERTDYVETIISTEPVEGAVAFEEIERDFSDRCKAQDVEPYHPAVVIFTAGLLGRALGATLSHGNLLSNSIMLRDQCNGNWEHHGLALIPMFHAFGASVNLLCLTRVGGTLYLVEKADFGKIIPWIHDARVTFTGMVPMVYYGLLYHPACNGLDLSSLTIAISGGAPLPLEIYEKFCNRYNIDLYHGYGLTEASPVVTWNNINVPNKPATVGVPIPDVTVAVHDDDGKPVPAGTEGEVVVQGPNVMLGYWGRPTETQTVIRDGWIYTGDIGHLDEDGYLTLTGLKKDLIITSGFNVYCQEVEEILIRHPQVSDVALRGLPDLMRGQVIEALIVPEAGARPEERDIIRFGRQYLSRYKCPRKVTFVKEIVRDQHGKPASWKYSDAH